MIIWKLEIEITGDDWENTEKYFFKTNDEAKAFKEQYEQEHTQEDPHLLTCPVSISPVVHSNYVTVLFAFADESTYIV